MPTNFPTGLDDFSAQLPRYVVDLEEALEAVEAKLGVTGSAVTTTVENKLTGLRTDVDAKAASTHLHDYVKADGATLVGDYRQVTDASIVSGQTALNSPTAAFTATDVGKWALVRSAGAGGANLITTIGAYVSATQVTLAAAAGTTVVASRTITDAVVTNGSKTVTSASAAFTAGDKHKNLTGSGSYSIATVVSATEITLNKVYEGTTGSGVTFTIGGGFLAVSTDDAPAIQAILDAAEATATTTGTRQTIVLPERAYGLRTGLVGKSNVVIECQGALFVALADIVPWTYTAKKQFHLRDARIRTAVQTTGPAIRLTGGCGTMWSVDDLHVQRNESQASYHFAKGIHNAGAINGIWLNPWVDFRSVSNETGSFAFHAEDDGNGFPPNAVTLVNPDIAGGNIGIQWEDSTGPSTIVGGAVQSDNFGEAGMKVLNVDRLSIQTHIEVKLGTPSIILQNARSCELRTPNMDLSRPIKLINADQNTFINVRGANWDIDAASSDNRIIACTDIVADQLLADLGTRTTYLGHAFFVGGVRPVVVRTAGAEVPQADASALETVKGVQLGQIYNGSVETAMVANTSSSVRFTVPYRFKPNRIAIYVGVSSGNIDLGIYADDGNGTAPGARLVSTGSMACPAAGRQAITITETLLVPGVYWLAMVADNATATFTHPDNRTGRINLIRNQASAFPLPATAATTSSVDTGPNCAVERR